MHVLPVLGTAQWGWTVGRADAFQLLEMWMRDGESRVDTSTNYPINKDPRDFRAAENLLEEFCRAHRPGKALDLTVKVGSLDNMRSPDINLNPSFLMMMADEYHRRFDDALGCLMIHWDKRNDPTAISDTAGALHRIHRDHGIRVGLSGIDHPDLYRDALDNLTCDIQLKHNVLQSDLHRYAPLADGNHRFFAYGINAGGVKLEGVYAPDSTLLARGGHPEKQEAQLEKLRAKLPDWNRAFARPPIVTMNHLGLLYAGLNPRLSGIVLGLRTPAQWRDTQDFWRNLEVFDYSDVFRDLQKMTA